VKVDNQHLKKKDEKRDSVSFCRLLCYFKNVIKGINPFIFTNFPANLNMKSLSLTYKNKV